MLRYVDRIQRLVPSLDGGDDFVWVLGPAEGARLGIGLGQNWLIACCSETMEWKMPRFNRCLVSLAKKPSTALIHEAEVGVKWKVQRGLRASQRRNARRAGLVAQQPGHALQHKAFLPAPDRRLGHPCLSHDRGGAVPVRRQQHHDAGRARRASAGRCGRDNGLQPLAVAVTDGKADPGRHRPDFACRTAPGESLSDSSVRFHPLGAGPHEIGLLVLVVDWRDRAAALLGVGGSKRLGTSDAPALEIGHHMAIVIVDLRDDSACSPPACRPARRQPVIGWRSSAGMH